MDSLIKPDNSYKSVRMRNNQTTIDHEPVKGYLLRHKNNKSMFQDSFLPLTKTLDGSLKSQKLHNTDLTSEQRTAATSKKDYNDDRGGTYAAYLGI